MELLERTRLGITNFLNVPTNDSGSLWPSSKILKRAFFDDLAKLIPSQKYFLRFGTYSKVKLQVFVFFCYRKYDVKRISEVQLPCGSRWNFVHSKVSRNCRFWVLPNKHLNRSWPSQFFVISLQPNPQKIHRQVDACFQRTSKMISYPPIFRTKVQGSHDSKKPPKNDQKSHFSQRSCDIKVSYFWW